LPSTISEEPTMGSSDVQGKLWGAASSDWLENEKFTIPLYEAVFEAVELAPGRRMLDVGCGAGLALRMAADRGAVVTGIDASEGLLGVARSRLPEADLRQGDVESLPFDDHSFDLVTSFNAIQFATDPAAALREAKRVLAPNGRFAIVTWGDYAQCDIRWVFSEIGRLVPSPPPYDEGPFALSAPGKLEALVAAVGLTPVATADVAAPFTYPDLDSAIRIQMSAGPLQRCAQVAGEEATRKALTDAFALARKDDGSYRLENEFRYLVATA
jgi:SAM-dependent methyltransferase